MAECCKMWPYEFPPTRRPAQKIANSPGNHDARCRELESRKLRKRKRTRNFRSPTPGLLNWKTQIPFPASSSSTPWAPSITSSSPTCSLFWLDLQKHPSINSSLPCRNTHLTYLQVFDAEKTVSFPVRFDRSFDLDSTNLLTRMVEIWGEVPDRAAPAPGPSPQPVRLHRTSGLHASPVAAPRLLRPGRSARAQDSTTCAGVRNSIGRSILWNCATGMPVPGVNCRMGTCCSCLTLSPPAAFAGWTMAVKRRSSAK